MRASVVIAAYRDAGYIEENVRKLAGDFEVILAVDDPSEELIGIARRYKLKVSMSNGRRGKWRALNDALKLVEGEYVIFLDSDTRLIELPEFKGDVIEFVKEVEGKGVLERLVNIDYFNMFLTAKLASRVNSCLSLNGAAFAAKREVVTKLGFRKFINEDTELGIRVGLSGYRVRVDGRAVTRAPSRFGEWLAQRERWAVGGAEALLAHLRRVMVKPRLWLPYLFPFYPAITGLAIALVLPDTIVLKLLYILLPLLLLISPKFAPFALLTVFELHVLKNFIAVLAAFAIWSCVIALCSIKTSFKIDFRLLPLYFFFYSPLWTMICVAALLKVSVYKLLGRKMEVEDWKT
ncbi:MAG: glycosyltransferase family 2 protein [Archaeoglobaceae archaeon]